MSRRWIALLLLIFLLVIIPGYFVSTDYLGLQGNTQGNTHPPPPTEHPPPHPTGDPDPEHPTFVIPENPLGTIGLTTALIAALAIFALMKKPTLKQI